MTRPPPPLGQHFLTDRNILQRIVDALDPTPGDVVVEIGAGEGSLTAVLAPRVRYVIAIERDRRLAHDCGLRIADGGLGNVEVVAGDALKQDWHALAVARLANPQSAIANPQLKVIGNIPYAITSPLIDKALTPPLPACIVFLVQAEVADRIAARPGSKTYGAPSVGVQAVCRVEKLFPVRAGAFTPRPSVASALLRLTPLAHPLVAVAELAAFRRFVTACFARRRKQLRNVLLGATGRPAAQVEEGLGALGLDPAARPETLAPEIFARLLRWSARL
ncbi:MAG: ribosomal RNA small subunit methyltransferase A [Gemmatimonadetes bacterium]|nr:MAG: ribosomal RNA small subunit methyltransferase A [Gemmatimonadota bacterium]